MSDADRRVEGIGRRVFRLSPDDALPLRIEHRRIYILPTRRGWAFLAVLLLMLVAAINYALSLGYALCFLLTGLFAASLLHTYRNLAGLELAGIRAGDGFAGDGIAFRLTLVTLPGRARRGIELVTRDRRARTRVDLEAGSTGVATLVVPGERRGALPLGRVTLASDWPIGLWRTWSYAHAPVRALVFPAPERAPPPLPQRADGDGCSDTRAAAEGDVAGLRPYADGDLPSRIAWKSAARGTALQVRLLERSDGPARTTLDLEATALPGLDARLSRLCAWVLEATRRGTPFSLALPGAPTLAHALGEAHRHQALSALALHGTRDGVSTDGTTS